MNQYNDPNQNTQRRFGGALRKFGCVVILVLALFIGLAVAVYPGISTTANHLNPLRQHRDAAWGEVQSQYQRRFDLFNRLADTVTAAAKFEQNTLTEVAKARASVGQVTIQQDKAPQSAEELQKFEQAQGQIASALSRIMSVQERYPDLKSNQNFLNMQATIEGTENRIAVARADFNTATLTYDTARNHWPESFYAKFIGFPYLPYFQADKDAQHSPDLHMADQFDRKK